MAAHSKNRLLSGWISKQSLGESEESNKGGEGCGGRGGAHVTLKNVLAQESCRSYIYLHLLLTHACVPCVCDCGGFEKRVAREGVRFRCWR